MGTRRNRFRKNRLSSKYQEGPSDKDLLGDLTLEDTHGYRVDRTQFVIYLHTMDVSPEDAEHVSESGINPTMANEFGRNLNILNGIDPKRPILVDMSTCGGDWESGMQIFSSILTCPNPVTVLAHRWARSMSSIVPLAADKFILMPTARYMYHYGEFQYSGPEKEADTEDIERRIATDRMLFLYVARLKEQGTYKKWGEQKILKLLENNLKNKVNVWLGSHEAVRLGFADEVFSENMGTSRAQIRNEKRRACMLKILNEDIRPKVLMYSRLRPNG